MVVAMHFENKGDDGHGQGREVPEGRQILVNRTVGKRDMSFEGFVIG